MSFLDFIHLKLLFPYIPFIEYVLSIQHIINFNPIFLILLYLSFSYIYFMLRYKGNKLKDNKLVTQIRTVHILQFLIFHYCMQL